ncbi:MAG: CBS domain-containing protein [Gaiellaceae bacterium]
MVHATHTPQKLPVPFESATAADAMSPGVISCPPETPLRVVARMMSTFNVHSVFVFEHTDKDDDDPKLWAIVSDLDLVAAARLDLDSRTAGASAVTPIVSVRANAPLHDAAELMALHGVAHLAVIDPKTHRPVGVISTLDIAHAIAAGRGSRETQASA